MSNSAKAPPSWIDLLRPVQPPVLQPIVPGSGAVAWYVELRFDRFALPEGAAKMPWDVTYGKTQIVGEDVAWSVAEIELVRRMRAGGWSSGWIDTFGSAPSAWASWLVDPGELPTPLRRAFNAITSDTGFGGGGKPDVIAWRGETLADAVFVEYKGPSDRIRPGQDAWLAAGLRAGILANQFVVAKWPKPRKRAER